ncbi:MAG: energy-coupling factor transporter ATPase [Clostridia bacterium]|nr:energy-coupling factor transporter ATPase [Clostridia bacterium]
MAVLETKNLNFVYADGMPFAHAALKDVSVRFEEGELTAIIGHTGSGKSTLVQHLNGLLKPASGQVLLDGKDIWENPKDIRNVRFRVGMVFQYPEHQLFAETVEQDIAFGPRNMGLSEEEIGERVREAAQLVGLTPALLEKSPFDLSGGEKRRAAIAGVLAMRPEILVLDEPTAGLDPQGREQLLDVIDNYRRTHNTTVLFVSHSMEDVARIADKVLVMQKSEVAMYDTVNAVFSRAAELENIGLSVPAVTRVLHLLRAGGLGVDTAVYTVDDAAKMIAALLQEKGVGSC